MIQRLASGLLAALLLAAPADAAPRAFWLLHTNDRHGQLLPRLDGATGPLVAGVAHEASLELDVRRQALAAGEPCLLVDAGDLFQGSPHVNDTKGECMTRALGALGFHLATLGNHEFDYGPAALAAQVERSRFLWVSSTVSLPALGPALRPYVTFTVGPARVAFLGATTLLTRTSQLEQNLRGVTLRDPVAVLGPLAARLRRQGATVVVLLSHLGFDEDRRVARAVPGLDLIVGGHTHTAVQVPIRVGSTHITQAGFEGSHVGVLRVALDDRGRVAGVTGGLRAVGPGLQPAEPAAAALVAGYEQRLAARLGEVLGHCSAEVDKGYAGVDSPAGVLVAAAFREAAGAELGLFNAGGVRASLPAGPVTVRSVLDVLPFGNHVVRLELTGRQLLSMIERSLRGPFAPLPEARLEILRAHGVQRAGGYAPSPRPTGFLIGDGLRYAFDPRLPEGRRLLSLELLGAPPDPARRYVVATNNYLAGGGDAFPEFTRGTHRVDLPILDCEALRAFVERRGTVSPPAAPSCDNKTLPAP